MSQRKRILDLAFAMDTTGSMGSYIAQAQQCIRSMVDDIVSGANADVHLAYVEYRDHPPQDNTYVTRVHDFTSSVRTMKGWLDNSKADGGGDTPEAVADALHAVLNLRWCGHATKLCILICDAPPHGLEASGDKFPNGCPSGHDCMQISNSLARKEVVLYVVGCDMNSVNWIEFYRALNYITSGQFVPLADATYLSKAITGGAQEELALEALMTDIDISIENQVTLLGADLNENKLIDLVYKYFSGKGTRVKQLNLNCATQQETSSTAIQIARLTNMAAVRSYLASGITTSYHSSTFTSKVKDVRVVESAITKEQIARMVRKVLQVRPLASFVHQRNKSVQTQILQSDAGIQATVTQATTDTQIQILQHDIATQLSITQGDKDTQTQELQVDSAVQSISSGIEEAEIENQEEILFADADI